MSTHEDSNLYGRTDTRKRAEQVAERLRERPFAEFRCPLDPQEGVTDGR